MKYYADLVSIAKKKKKKVRASFSEMGTTQTNLPLACLDDTLDMTSEEIDTDPDSPPWNE